MRINLIKTDVKDPFLKARTVSWVGSILTILLAVLPGINEHLGGPESQYDSSIAILSATLITIIWYTYWTYKSVITPSIEEKNKHESYRKAVATALITELQWIDKIIRDLYQGGVYTYRPISLVFFKDGTNNLYLFSVDTIKLIALFQNRVYDLNEMYMRCISKSKLSEDGRGKITDIDFIRMKSVLVCDILNSLVDSLLSEGGSMPNSLKFVDNSQGLPKLPERKFEEPVRLPNPT